MMVSEENRLRAQASSEKWSNDRLNETLVDTLFPYYRANTDPASPAAGEALRAEYLKEQGDDAIMLNPKEYADLYTALEQQTRVFNAVHGVNYVSPPIIVVDGLQDADATPMKFDHDAILIDKKFLDNQRNNPTLITGMAHELAHRYQRNDNYLRAKFKANEMEIEITASESALSRSMEAEADFDARRVSKPGALSQFLKNILRDDAIVLGHHMASNPRLASENAVESYNALSADKQEQLKKEAAALPEEVKNEYFIRGIQAIDGSGVDSFHPKVQDRLDLLAALDRYPAVLSCRNVQFDGSATIIEATSCGPSNVPLVVDGVPTGNRVRQ